MMHRRPQPTGRPLGGAARRARGFTVVELLLALLLAGVVMAAALGLLQLLSAADDRIAAKFNRSVELTIAQTAMRRTFATMIAGRDTGDEEEADREGDEDRAAEPPEELAGAVDGELADALAAAAGGDEPDNMLEAVRDQTRANSRRMLDLYFEPTSTGVLAQTLEVVLPEAPIKPDWVGDGVELAGERARSLTDRETAGTAAALLSTRVRGRFEVAMVPGSGYTLVWRSVEPPAPPVELIGGIDTVPVDDLFADGEAVSLRWSVLPLKFRDAETRERYDWQPVWAAWLRDDFPIAVKLAFQLEDGTKEDWMFEASVTVQDLEGNRR